MDSSGRFILMISPFGYLQPCHIGNDNMIREIQGFEDKNVRLINSIDHEIGDCFVCVDENNQIFYGFPSHDNPNGDKYAIHKIPNNIQIKIKFVMIVPLQCDIGGNLWKSYWEDTKDNDIFVLSVFAFDYEGGMHQWYIKCVDRSGNVTGNLFRNKYTYMTNIGVLDQNPCFSFNYQEYPQYLYYLVKGKAYQYDLYKKNFKRYVNHIKNIKCLTENYFIDDNNNLFFIQTRGGYHYSRKFEVLNLSRFRSGVVKTLHEFRNWSIYLDDNGMLINNGKNNNRTRKFPERWDQFNSKIIDCTSFFDYTGGIFLSIVFLTHKNELFVWHEDNGFSSLSRDDGYPIILPSFMSSKTTIKGSIL